MSPRLVSFALILVAAVLLVAPTTSAHANAKSSVPAFGAQLDAAPDAVQVDFTEPVDPAVTRLTLLNASKAEFALGTLEVRDDGYQVRAMVEKDLPAGAYVLKWETVSTADGHRTFGSIPFGVQQPADLSAAESGAQGLRIDMVVGKALAFAGLALVAGAFGFWYLVLPRGHRKGHEDRIERVGHVGAWAHLAGLALFAYGDYQNKGLAAIDLFVGTVFGQGLLLRLALAFLLVIGFHVSVKRDDLPRHLWGAMAAVAALAFVVQGRFSHTPGFVDPPWWGIAVDAFHFAAIGLWVGGLIAFAAWLYGLPQDRDELAHELKVVPKRFSDVATWSIVVVSITGVVMMWVLLGFSPDAYTEGTYGRLLGLKILLAVAMMFLGGLNKWFFVRRYQRGGGFGTLRAFRDNVHREVGIAVIVFLLAGAATNLSPPAPGLAPAEDVDLSDLAAGPGLQTEQVETETYNWTVNFHPPPALNGETHYFLTINDKQTDTRVHNRTDDGQPLPHTAQGGVSMTIENLDDPELGSTKNKLAFTKTGTWETYGSFFSLPGTYEVTFHVRTQASGYSGSTVSFQFELE